MTSFRNRSFVLTLICAGTLLASPAGARPDADSSSATADAAAKAAAAYRVDSTKDCDGFPRLPIQTMKGSCVGLVMDATTKDPATSASLTFPRKILALPGTGEFIVTDMGGWAPANRGKVFRLVREKVNGRTRYGLRLLFKNLLLPHGMALGPDGFVYVGEMGTIFKFNPAEKNPVRMNVIGGFPTNVNADNLHPLTNFAFGQSSADRWDLYVNIGAPSDHCTKEKISNKVCDQSDGSPGFAQVRRYPYLGNNTWNPKFEVFARGLRNSMALLSHPSGSLLQAENGRDLKDMMQPFEEINLLKKGRHYGWPYCFNFSARSEEWPAWDCKSDRYEKPYVLMPPHVAPLDMMYYSGKMFPELQNKLLVSWHGYQATGQRIAAYSVDDLGLPVIDGVETRFNVNGTLGAEAMMGQPLGGSIRSSSHIEVVSEWFPLSGIRPKGAPVGITQADNGSIWIVDDKNKTILRVARTNEELTIDNDQRARAARVQQWVKAVSESPKQMAAFEVVRKKVFSTSCQECHSGFVLNEALLGQRKAELEYLFTQPGWISPGKPEDSLIVKRLKGAGGTLPMPPSGALAKPSIDEVEKWIRGLTAR